MAPRYRRNALNEKISVDHLHSGWEPADIDLEAFVAKHNPTKSFLPEGIDTFRHLAKKNAKLRRELNHTVGMEVFDSHASYRSSSSSSESEDDEQSGAEGAANANASKSTEWTTGLTEDDKADEVDGEKEEEGKELIYLPGQSPHSESVLRRKRHNGKPLGFTAKEVTFRHPDRPSPEKRKRRRRKVKKSTENKQNMNAANTPKAKTKKQLKEEEERRVARSMRGRLVEDIDSPNKKGPPSSMQVSLRQRSENLTRVRQTWKTWMFYVQISKRERKEKVAKMKKLNSKDEEYSRYSIRELRLMSTFSAWCDYHINHHGVHGRFRALSTDESELRTPEPQKITRGPRRITLADRQAHPRPRSATAKFVHSRPLTPFKIGKRERFDGAQKGIWHGNPTVRDHYGPDRRAVREAKGILKMSRNLVKRVNKANRPYTKPEPPRCGRVHERPTSAPMTRRRVTKGVSEGEPESRLFASMDNTEGVFADAFADLDILEEDVPEDMRKFVKRNVKNYAALYQTTRLGENPNWNKPPVQYHSHGPGHKSRRLRRHQADPEFEAMPRMQQVKHNMALLDHWFGISDEPEDEDGRRPSTSPSNLRR